MGWVQYLAWHCSPPRTYTISLLLSSLSAGVLWQFHLLNQTHSTAHISYYHLLRGQTLCVTAAFEKLSLTAVNSNISCLIMVMQKVTIACARLMLAFLIRVIIRSRSQQRFSALALTTSLWSNVMKGRISGQNCKFRIWILSGVPRVIIISLCKGENGPIGIEF